MTPSPPAENFQVEVCMSCCAVSVAQKSENVLFSDVRGSVGEHVKSMLPFVTFCEVMPKIQDMDKSTWFERAQRRAKQLKAERGILKKDLADKIGVSAGRLSNWMNGQAEPSIFWQKKIAEAFEMTLEELFADQQTDKIARTKDEEIFLHMARSLSPEDRQAIVALFYKRVPEFDSVETEEEVDNVEAGDPER